MLAARHSTSCDYICAVLIYRRWSCEHAASWWPLCGLWVWACGGATSTAGAGCRSLLPRLRVQLKVPSSAHPLALLYIPVSPAPYSLALLPLFSSVIVVLATFVAFAVPYAITYLQDRFGASMSLLVCVAMCSIGGLTFSIGAPWYKLKRHERDQAYSRRSRRVRPQFSRQVTVNGDRV